MSEINKKFLIRYSEEYSGIVLRKKRGFSETNGCKKVSNNITRFGTNIFLNCVKGTKMKQYIHA